MRDARAGTRGTARRRCPDRTPRATRPRTASSSRAARAHVRRDRSAPLPSTRGAEHLGDRRRSRASFVARFLRTLRATASCGDAIAVRRSALPARSAPGTRRDRARGRGRRGRGRRRTSTNPASVASCERRSAWWGASSSTSAPPAGSSQRGRLGDQRLERLEAGGPAHQRAARLPVDDVAREVGHLVLGDVRRVRHDHAQRGRAARPAARRTTSPARARTRVAAEPDAGEVRARDGQRVVAHVGGPHLGVGQLACQRERDRAGAGAEVGDRVRRVGRQPRRRACRDARRAARPRRSRSAPPPRSRVAAPAPDDRPGGRGPRKSHRPSTYCNGSPAARRSSMSSRCCRRASVAARSCSSITSSTPS